MKFTAESDYSSIMGSDCLILKSTTLTKCGEQSVDLKPLYRLYPHVGLQFDIKMWYQNK